MITTVSIAIYALSVFFSAGLGATSVKFKNGEEFKSEATLGVSLTFVTFVLASVLQLMR